MIHAAQVSPIASAAAWERSMFRPVHADGLDPATQHGYKKAGAPGACKDPCPLRWFVRLTLLGGQQQMACPGDFQERQNHTRVELLVRALL